MRDIKTADKWYKTRSTSYTWPCLEYAAPAWHSSLTQVLSEQLKNIQKRTFRIIVGTAYPGYNNALTSLSLPSLHERRDKLWLDFVSSPPRVPPTAQTCFQFHRLGLRNIESVPFHTYTKSSEWVFWMYCTYCHEFHLFVLISTWKSMQSLKQKYMDIAIHTQ